MKNWLWQKYSWAKLLVFIASCMVKAPFKGIYYSIIGNNERAVWWYKETIEAYYWLKIHLTYKSTRIK